MSRETPQVKYRTDYTPPDYLADQLSMTVDIREASTRISASLSLRRNPERPDGQPLVLDGREMELESVTLDGRELAPDSYHVTPTQLIVDQVPETFELATVVRINPDDNTAMEGFYRSGDVLCTQCEPHGFSRITYYPDRPDVMAPMATTIEADRARYPLLLCNGNPVERGEAGGNRHWVRWDDPHKKPCYLFAMVAGDLEEITDSHTTSSGREVALRLYVDHGNEDRTAHAMEALKAAMAWDERRYGLEYDLDVYMIVAVDAFNMGAMENKGLNLFNSSCILASKETATDRDYERVWTVVGHEYFHNWTGNRVTCRDWFQLSLKESLTVFREEQFSAETEASTVHRIDKARLLRAMQFPEDGGPMAHPVSPESYIEVNNFYTLTVYEKGAEVIRMMHTLLGDEAFVAGVRLYLERHDGQAATIEDFMAALEAASGKDLAQFRRWYSQAGTPELSVTDDFDASASVYTLDLGVRVPPTPGQPEKEPMHIPLAVGLVDQSGAELPLRGEQAAGDVLELREADNTFRFTGMEQKPVPSLLRGFSAPVKLNYDYTPEQLNLLMVHDSDPFNRWQAAQQLAVGAMLELAEPGVTGSDKLDTLIEGWRTLLNRPGEDRALLAEIMTLPVEPYLAEQMEPIDVEGLSRARRSARRRIIELIGAELLSTYECTAASADFRHTPEEAGRRRLCAICLGYLTLRGEAGDQARALAHYQGADNMSDAAMALSALNNVPGEERETAFADFEQRWLDTPLVLNKWFSWQAIARREDAPERVAALMEHDRFALDNPTRVRGLLGAFNMSNLPGFHRADGAGYRLIADVTLKLDGMNPQMAARMASAFSRWRRFDDQRQALMKEQLQRMAAREDLSAHTYEVVSKSLGENRETAG